MRTIAVAAGCFFAGFCFGTFVSQLVARSILGLESPGTTEFIVRENDLYADAEHASAWTIPSPDWQNFTGRWIAKGSWSQVEFKEGTIVLEIEPPTTNVTMPSAVATIRVEGTGYRESARLDVILDTRARRIHFYRSVWTPGAEPQGTAMQIASDALKMDYVLGPNRSGTLVKFDTILVRDRSSE